MTKYDTTYAQIPCVRYSLCDDVTYSGRIYMPRLIILNITRHGPHTKLHKRYYN